MSFLDNLLGRSRTPTDKKIASTVTVLQRRHGEPAIRYQAADKLASWGTPAAIEGLLKRFTVTVASEMSDDEEKAYVAELVEKKGEEAVPLVVSYLRREAEVSWALRILSKVLPPDEFRARVVEVLSALDPHFDPNPQRKVEMIEALAEHATQPDVARVVSRFLTDTDDAVRIEASAVLSRAGAEEDVTALVDCLIDSRDRARVISAVVENLVERALSVKGRKADVESVLPSGYYVTREGVVKRLGK